jgi:hypothetical protein
MVIIGTVLLQGLSARPLARLLKVAQPDPDGVLIVGANPVARTIADALKQVELPVKLADTGWENVSVARMKGFDTYFGRVVSEHADRHMELVGIGKLLAVSPHSTLNALACIRYKTEFGAENIFRLQTSEEEHIESHKAIHPSYTGRKLFGEEVTHAKLASLISQGAETHITTLSEDFDFTRYRERYQNRAIALFALDGQGKLRFFTTGAKLQPKPGWKIASLLPANLLDELREKDEENGSKPGQKQKPTEDVADTKKE